MIDLQELFAKIKPERLSTQEAEYHTGIVNKVWEKDKDTINYFWPNSNHGQRNLWNLKDKVFGKLIAAILNQSGESNIQDTYIECWREYAAVQVLRGLNLKRGAIWISERLLKKALKIEQTEICVSLANFLEFNSARHSGTNNNQTYYFEIGEQQEKILAAEKKAQRYFMEITSGFSTSQGIDNELVLKAEKYAMELRSRLEYVKSYRFILLTYRVMCMHAQVLKNQDQLIAICNEALDAFKNRETAVPRSVIFGFNFILIQASIKMEDYQAAREYIYTALTIDPEGSHNHNACLLYQAILGLHSNDPELTRSAIQKSTKHRKYASIQEQWHLVEAYATFLDYDIGKPFRISKFLNQVPIFSKDKRGNNISILILQVLFYLKQNQKGKIIDRVEALKLYSQRYLKQDSTFRSNCFIHMLATLPKANFHPVAVQRHAKKYSDQLSKYQSDEVEVIPYEELWKRVINLLE